MEELLSFLNNVHLWVAVGAGILNIVFWISSGFKVPRYIHYIAFFAFLLGLWLAWMGRNIGDPNAEKAAWLVIIFPAIVYVAFVFYGGGIDHDN